MAPAIQPAERLFRDDQPSRPKAAVGGPAPRATGSRAWRMLRRYPIPLLTAALFLVSAVLWLTGLRALTQWPLLAIIVIGGVPLIWSTLRQVLRAEFGADLIAALAIVGALLLQEYLAGAVIVLMLSGGMALEAFALRRARRSLSALAERAPRFAHVWRGDQLVTLAAEEVAVNMTVVVKPGELIPVDGVVVNGSTSVSEADLTGEPTPVRKEPGSLVMSGSVNQEGIVEVRATRPSADSQYAHIVRLVDAAQQQKAPIHRLADRYGGWFTLVAMVTAATAGIISHNSTIALAVLVVATPCPLILATPIAIMSGINVAAHRGIIVKSGATIEQLGEVDVAIFDKTGTLTLGTPRLVDVVPYAAPQSTADYDAATLLRLAASVEQLSTHVLARAVVEAAKEYGLTLLPAIEFAEVLGKGVRARIPDPGQPPTPIHAPEGSLRALAIGNRTYMRSLAVAVPEDVLADRERRITEGQLVSFIAVVGRVVGLLVFADVPRPELACLSVELKRVGIRQTVLLTGDGPVAAKRIAAVAQVDQVVARCLPEQKVEAIVNLERQGHQVLMVGDGVNDAPALATATVGLALGAQGLTAAAAVADGVLLSNDILQVVAAVRLGRHVMRVARQGIWVGMGLSLVAMAFAALGFLPPVAGAILQEGIDVLVIVNALRAGTVQHSVTPPVAAATTVPKRAETAPMGYV
jgi:heavy metal translocating P-type ATPase